MMIEPAVNHEGVAGLAEFGDAPLVGRTVDGAICNNRLYGYTGLVAVFR